MDIRGQLHHGNKSLKSNRMHKINLKSTNFCDGSYWKFISYFFYDGNYIANGYSNKTNSSIFCIILVHFYFLILIN